MDFQKIFRSIPNNVNIHERIATSTVIFQDHQLLMVRTNKYDYKFPGGGRENEENDIDTVIREVLEETGYRIASVDRLLARVIQNRKDCYNVKLMY